VLRNLAVDEPAEKFDDLGRPPVATVGRALEFLSEVPDGSPSKREAAPAVLQVTCEAWTDVKREKVDVVKAVLEVLKTRKDGRRLDISLVQV
jgi:thymidylate synthase